MALSHNISNLQSKKYVGTFVRKSLTMNTCLLPRKDSYAKSIAPMKPKILEYLYRISVRMSRMRKRIQERAIAGCPRRNGMFRPTLTGAF